jgi:arginyl-tRNA synthetase
MVDLFAELRRTIGVAMAVLTRDPALAAEADVEIAPDMRTGDVVSRVALRAAPRSGWRPLELAHALAARLAKDPDIAEALAAGPGLVTITLRQARWRRWLAVMLAADDRGDDLAGRPSHPAAPTDAGLERARAVLRDMALARIAAARIDVAEMDRDSGDAFRLAMLAQPVGRPLERDMPRWTEQSYANPAFSIRYAHARARSLMKRAPAGSSFAVPTADTAFVEGHRPLLRRLAVFPDRVIDSAASGEPHRLVQYLHDVAGHFHAAWNPGKDQPHLRFINDDDPQSNTGRLAIVRATQLVLVNGLGLLGVSAPDEMR